MTGRARCTVGAVRRSALRTASLAWLIALAGCLGDGTTTTSTEPTGLVPCPTATAQAASATIEPATGGAVVIGATNVQLPAGAVTAPTLISLELPASSYDEIRLTANGLSTFVLALPATVTLDYAHCTTPGLDQRSLTVWRIDPQTKARLEDMHGADQKSRRVVTFETTHFSSYALAY